MILTPRPCFDTGAKSSASPRTRKTSTRKSKSSDGSVQSQNPDLTSDPVFIANQKIEPPAVQTTNNRMEVSSEMTQIHSEMAQIQSDMNQVHSEQTWQGDGQNEIYSDGQEHSGYSDEEGYYDGESLESAGEQVGQNQNQILLTLSYSLMNHVRQVARMEGVFPEDILIELIAEGVTRRAFEDAQRPAPSHLMTRTGYVAPDANGNVQQPQLSHHGMQGNQRGNHQGHNNNRRFHQSSNNRGNHFQGRNRQNQYKSKPRSGK